MATRSTIAIEREDGSVSQIYCHWDGYLDHVGKILKQYYNTAGTVEALIALGAVSSLDKSIEKPEGHTFSSAYDGYTVFYGRDRGDKDMEANRYQSFKEYFLDHDFEDYNYIFKDGQWHYARNEGGFSTY